MERLFADADRSVKSSLSMKPSYSSLKMRSNSRAQENPGGLSRMSLENSVVLKEVKFKEMQLK